MNAKDREQAKLTADEINTLQYMLEDYIERLKSTFQGGMHGYDEKLMLYNMLVIEKKLQLKMAITKEQNAA